MRKIVLFISILQTFFAFAQVPEFKATNTAGIFYYNADEAIEKLKVKKEDKKIKVIAALRDYNAKVKKVSFLNVFKFKELDLLVNTANKNFSSLQDDERRNLSEKMQSVILPVRDSLVASEKTLNATLEKILSSKQQKKWLKYQRTQKKKLIPEPPRTQNNNVPPMQNRMGRNNRRF